MVLLIFSIYSLSLSLLLYLFSFRSNDVGSGASSGGPSSSSSLISFSSQQSSRITTTSEMRTSRIAQETSKLSQAISPSKPTSRRQTRSFANSLSAFAAAGSPVTATTSIPQDDGSSSLSSAASTIDIEDYPHLTPSRKRKRGVNTPSTVVSSMSISTRNSPRKGGVKTEVETTGAKTKKVGKVKRQPAKELVNDAGEVEIHPPANWEEVYEAVKEMRKRVLAPVDTMGCESLADEGLSERVGLQCCSLWLSGSILP